MNLKIDDVPTPYWPVFSNARGNVPKTYQVVSTKETDIKGHR